MNVKCVVCNLQFDQDDAEHYDLSVPFDQRWTCKKTCQQRLRMRAERLSEIKDEVADINTPEVLDSTGSASEADKARKALDPDTEEESHGVPGDSDVRSCLKAAATLALLAETMSGEEDQYVLSGIALGYIITANSRIEARIAMNKNPLKRK